MNKILYASHHTVDKEPKEVVDELQKTSFDGLEILADKKHSLDNQATREVFKKTPI